MAGGGAERVEGKRGTPFLRGVPWLRHAGLAACTLLAVAARGYGYGVEDQNLYLPFLLKWNDPSLFPADLLLTQGFARESVVWVLLSALGRLASLEAVFLGTYLAASYATLFFVHRLARAWWDDGAAAWIAVFLWIPAYTVPGVANTTFDAYLTTRILGGVFALAALEAFFRRRNGASALWVLGGGLVHLVTAVPVAAGLVLAHGVRGRWRPAAQVTGALGAAGGLLWAFGAGAGRPHALLGLYSGEWLEVVRQVDAELFPLLWPAVEWRRLIFLLACFGGLAAVRFLGGRATPAEREGLLVASGALLAAAAGVAGSAAGVALLVQFSLLRGTWLLILLLALTLSGSLAELLRTGRVWGIGLGAFAAAGWATGAAALQACSTACAAAVPWLLRAGDGWRWVRGDRSRLLRGLLALLLLVLLWHLVDFLPIVHPRNLFADGRPWLQAGILAAVAAGAALLLPSLRGGRAARVLPAALGLFFLLVPPRPVAMALHDRPWFGRMYGTRVAHARVKGARAEKDREALRAMGDLVRRHVPEGASVAVPCDWMTFRLDSLRSPFVTYKDGAPAEFDAAYCAEWLRRVRLVRAFEEGERRWTRTPDQRLPEAVWRDLARGHASVRLEYLVSRHDYELPVVGAAGGMTLYRLGP
ncbi:MAG: DUF6798 domain-containing protein [Acidobacteriota bacterium]